MSNVSNEINNPRAEGARVNFRPLLYDFAEKLALAVPIGAVGENFFKIAYFLNIFDKYLPFFPPCRAIFP